MHAKFMHIAWRTTAGNRAHTLVYGSGNATGAAFSGGINAELFCRVRLTAAKHRHTILWAEGVSAAVTGACTGVATHIVEHPDVELARGVLVGLPSMRVKPADARIGSFDLWLQRGFIVVEYRPNPEFLRISVDLRERLPPGTLEQRYGLMRADKGELVCRHPLTRCVHQSLNQHLCRLGARQGIVVPFLEKLTGGGDLTPQLSSAELSLLSTDFARVAALKVIVDSDRE